MTRDDARRSRDDAMLLANVVDGLTAAGAAGALNGTTTGPLADLVISSDAAPRVATGQDADLPRLDGAGALALPGFTDLYARLREPGPSRRGTLATECRAAMAAGFTRVCAAPDTDPAMDSLATVELVLHRAAGSGGARVLPTAALTVGLAGERLAELATLRDAGCVAAGHADVPIGDTRLLHDAMAYARTFSLPLILRARDARLGINGCAHAGAIATRLGLRGIPVAAETIALARLLELVRETGAQLHVSRLSAARSVALVREARRDGLPVSADVGLSHLHFTDADIDGYDARYASSVPFRGEADRDALREAVADGTIDAICSDHAPLDTDASLAPFPQVEPGLSTYDRFLPSLLALPEVAGIPLHRAIDAVTAAPARVIGRATPPGDVVLIDRTAVRSGWHSRGRNSPLLDAEALRGVVAEVLLAARVASVASSD